MSFTAVTLLLALLIVRIEGYVISKGPRGVEMWKSQRSRRKLSNALEMVKKDWQPKEDLGVGPEDQGNGISFSVEMSKRAGLSWGSDISFSWIYVLDIEPTGEAASSGMIQKGDYIIGLGDTSTTAKDFDFVLTTLNQMPSDGSSFNYTFFRGSKEQLLGGPVPSPQDTTVTVTVKQDGKEDRILQCPGGTNLRRLLVGNGINVYRSLTRWTNCNGQQRCGTCIVNIDEGGMNCSKRAIDEESVLMENPPSYRLSCRTEVYGDVTVTVQTPVGAAQWTR
jgi:ferredoxin